MSKPVITRFAPSPTGYLHIGGARTALFNWLYARHTGGKFLLRIEDTDRERSTDAAVKAILDGLAWLELDWDGEPLYQFARAQRHRAVAEELLAAGKAYRCYLKPTELEAMQKAIFAERELAKQEKRPPRGPQTIQSPWRDRDPKEAPAGVAPVLRLRAPREGETVIDDRVQGRVAVPNTQLDDMIILRSDGSPVYNHAVVVDDHDMGITHVIRGVDHLTNAARQVQIYKAMGWDVPIFAHVPLIHGPDGAKLSKRHGALGIEAYRAMGYLPAGLRNYLVRLGWSHGDDEIFSTEQMVEWFDIDDINKAPGRLDFAKLADVNSHYIRQSSDAELAAADQGLPGRGRGRVCACRQVRAGRLGSVHQGAAHAQGPGQDLERAGGWRRLRDRGAAPQPRRQGPEGARSGRPRDPRQVAAAARSRARLASTGAGGHRPQLRRSRRAKARQYRPAAAGRPDRRARFPRRCST